MSDVIQKAKQLATERHAHLTLYNAARTPAIIHISEVANWVDEQGGSEDMVAAAWLHDIVEDTDVTLPEIRNWFGEEIAGLVDGLTDPPHFAALPLPIRKAYQAERLKEKKEDVKRIKICDQLSNVRRVVNDPPVDWDAATNLQYIEGAREVTNICRGLCPPLDQLFDAVYEQGCVKYGKI